MRGRMRQVCAQTPSLTVSENPNQVAHKMTVETRDKSSFVQNEMQPHGTFPDPASANSSSCQSQRLGWQLSNKHSRSAWDGSSPNLAVHTS
jgi:hypothetical protein